MRKFIIALGLLLGIFFVIGRFAEVQQVVDTLQRGDWRWLLLAALVQGAWMVNVAASFRALYRLLGVEEHINRLVPLAAAANFVNVVAPSMGMGGMAIFIVDGRRRRLPAARVTTAVALYVLFDYAGFLAVLTLGLLVLFRRNQLNAGEIVASLILVGVAIFLATLLYLGMKSAERLGRTLAWLGRVVNRALYPILRRDYLSIERAHSFAHEIAEGLALARQTRDGWLLPGALALSNKALLITILFLVFMSFKQPFSVGTLIAGFSIGYLFLIVSPTPSGIGFVEGAMTIALGSLRVPLGAAAVIALAYRGITFWLPLLYGMLAIRWVGQAADEDQDPTS